MSLSEDERKFFTRQGRSCDAADIIAKTRLESAVLLAAEAVNRWADADGHLCIGEHERAELDADLRKAIRRASS